MKHNFTRDQIEQAVIEAAKKRAGFCIDQMLDSAPHNVTLGEVGDLRAFLRALPELDPSYPEIPIEDVRKGDIESMHELRKVLAAHAPDWGNND